MIRALLEAVQAPVEIIRAAVELVLASVEMRWTIVGRISENRQK